MSVEDERSFAEENVTYIYECGMLVGKIYPNGTFAEIEEGDD